MSASAYVVNSQNEGNPYEPEIYKSLVYGLNASIPNTFSLKLKQPLKNMAISGNGKLIAAFSIGGVITIFQPNFVKIIDIKIPFQKLESFCFTKNNDLLVGSTDGLIHLYDHLIVLVCIHVVHQLTPQIVIYLIMGLNFQYMDYQNLIFFDKQLR